MAVNDKVLITLELGSGSFRILTPEAVYQINSNAVNPTPEACAARPPAPADAPSGRALREISRDVDQDFFREISEELYSTVGRLTRHLSVSIEDLPSDQDNRDWSQSGEKLETAKGQLEEVVKITEKASMEIMDLADLIQEDLSRLSDQLTALNGLEFMNQPVGGGPGPAAAAPPTGGPSREELQAKIGNLIDFVQTLALENPAVPAGPGARGPLPPKQPAPVSSKEIVRFNMDAVFQALYEFCTDEAVKDHLKEMWHDQAQSFDKAAIEQALSELADSVDLEDNFHNFPIPAVLKTLYAATPNEKYKTILKKMNQTATSIFIDSVLPIEGLRETVEVPAPEEDLDAEEYLTPEPDATQPEPVGLELAEGEILEPGLHGLDSRRMMELLDQLEALAAAIEVFSPPPPTANGDYTQVRYQDREAVVNSVAASNELIQKTMGHLTNILEALSFQDLSGQRIKRIVALINDVQMQLLSLLVSVGSKLKVREGSPDLAANVREVEEIAKVEAEKMMEKVQPSSSELQGPGAESRLDQTEVNNLLAQLGF